MTSTGYPNRSVIRAGRRWLSQFLLAVFLPQLIPAEAWASLARPPPPEPLLLAAATSSGFAPAKPAAVPLELAVYRIEVARVSPDTFAVTVTPEPLCTQAAASLLYATPETPPYPRSPACIFKNAYRRFFIFQHAEVLDEKTKAKQWQVNLAANGFRRPTPTGLQPMAGCQDGTDLGRPPRHAGMRVEHQRGQALELDSAEKPGRTR